MDNKENLYKAINYLNSTKFVINIKLLNYLTNEGKWLLEKKRYYRIWIFTKFYYH